MKTDWKGTFLCIVFVNEVLCTNIYRIYLQNIYTKTIYIVLPEDCLGFGGFATFLAFIHSSFEANCFPSTAGQKVSTLWIPICLL